MLLGVPSQSGGLVSMKPFVKALIVSAFPIGMMYYVGNGQLFPDESFIALLLFFVAWLGFEVEKLKEASGQPSREHRTKIIEQIERGEAVEPKHNPPYKPLNPLRQSEDDDQMFRDFVGFANEVNKQLDYGGWRLQEEARGSGTRNYTILYNGLNMGKLELRPWEYPYRTADTKLAAIVEISHVRFLPYDTAFRFLETLVLLICSDTHLNFGLAKAEMENRLAAYLLETIRKPALDYPLSIYIVGRPLDYFGKGEVRQESQPFLGGLGEKHQRGFHRLTGKNS